MSSQVMKSVAQQARILAENPAAETTSNNVLKTKTHEPITLVFLHVELDYAEERSWNRWVEDEGSVMRVMLVSGGKD